MKQAFTTKKGNEEVKEGRETKKPIIYAIEKWKIWQWAQFVKASILNIYNNTPQQHGKSSVVLILSSLEATSIPMSQ